MTRRRITIRQDGTTIVVTGWGAHKLALGAGVKTLYNGVQRGWVGNASKLPQLVAYCQYRNVSVEIIDDVEPEVPPVQTWTPHSESGRAVASSRPGPDHQDHQLDLFGGPGGAE